VKRHHSTCSFFHIALYLGLCLGFWSLLLFLLLCARIRRVLRGVAYRQPFSLPVPCPLILTSRDLIHLNISRSTQVNSRAHRYKTEGNARSLHRENPIPPSSPMSLSARISVVSLVQGEALATSISARCRPVKSSSRAHVRETQSSAMITTATTTPVIATDALESFQKNDRVTANHLESQIPY